MNSCAVCAAANPHAPPHCAECGYHHQPGLLHAKDCPACYREVVRGRKSRDSRLCGHGCSKRGCMKRVRIDRRGYVLSAFCDEHTRALDAALDAEKAERVEAVLFAKVKTNSAADMDVSHLRSAARQGVPS